MNKKIILGFAGLPASGKGTVAEYLEKKYQASTYRFSKSLQDALGRFYLPITRDNLIKMSEIVRGAFGEDVLAKAMAADVQADQSQLIVVEGERRPADIEYLRRLPGFVLVEIFADPKVRHSRVIKRGEKADDGAKTFEQFLADEQRSTELSTVEVSKEASEHIDNNGTLDELYHSLDSLIEKYQ